MPKNTPKNPSDNRIGSSNDPSVIGSLKEKGYTRQKRTAKEQTKQIKTITDQLPFAC